MDVKPFKKKRNQNDRRQFVNHIGTALLVFVLIALAYSSLQSIAPGEEVKEVSLSELATSIEADTVREIIVEGNSISIELSDGTKQTSRKGSEVDITQSLVNLGV